jgi:hypothetical protein
MANHAWKHALRAERAARKLTGEKACRDCVYFGDHRIFSGWARCQNSRVCIEVHSDQKACLSLVLRRHD